MSVNCQVTFTRSRVIVACPEVPGARLRLSIGGVEASSSGPGPDGRLSAEIPLDRLQALPTLQHEIDLVWPDGSRDPLSLPASPLLNRVDIRTPAQFFERVQLQATRITDPEALRFCSRRLLVTDRTGFDIRSAAICTLGYRIVDGNDPADPDLPFLWREARATLSLPSEGEAFVRWKTSIMMMLTYVSILQRDLAQTEEMLSTTLSYRPYLPRLSLLHTNFSRCDTLLALIRLAQGRQAEALDLLADVEEVFRVGARSSHIDFPGRGLYQYSEIVAVLEAARVAREIKGKAENARDRAAMMALAASIPVVSMTVLMQGLVKDGHWQALLEAAHVVPAAEAEVSALPLDALVQSLTEAAATLRREATEAAQRDDVAYAPAAAPRLDAAMAMEAELRQRGRAVLPALRDLAMARLFFGLLYARGGRPGAANLVLSGTTRWIKLTLGAMRFQEMGEFEIASEFTALGLACYLLAYRHVRPEAQYADEGVVKFVMHYARRAFRDEPALLELVEENLGGPPGRIVGISKP